MGLPKERMYYEKGCSGLRPEKHLFRWSGRGGGARKRERASKARQEENQQSVV